MSVPRRPNFLRFIVAGAVIGAVIGLVLAFRTDNPAGYAVSDGRGYVTLTFAGLGALIAAVVAVLIDMSIQRRRG
jgi:uncharacterized membrane protein YedE/YeeE